MVVGIVDTKGLPKTPLKGQPQLFYYTATVYKEIIDAVKLSTTVTEIRASVLLEYINPTWRLKNLELLIKSPDPEKNITGRLNIQEIYNPFSLDKINTESVIGKTGIYTIQLSAILASRAPNKIILVADIFWKNNDLDYTIGINFYIERPRVPALSFWEGDISHNFFSTNPLTTQLHAAKQTALSQRSNMINVGITDHIRNSIRQSLSINVDATVDKYGSSILLLDYLISQDNKYNVKIYNPNFWLVLLGQGLSLRDKVRTLNVVSGEMASYCAVKLILAALLYGKFDLKYLLQKNNQKFLNKLSSTRPFNSWLEFFNRVEYINYEYYFSNCYNIYPGVEPTESICPINTQYSTVGTVQEVITSDKNIEIIINNGKLQGDLIGFKYSITNNSINITYASYQQITDVVKNEWNVYENSIDPILAYDVGFSITQNNIPNVDMIFISSKLNLKILVNVRIIDTNLIKIVVTPYTSPLYDNFPGYTLKIGTDSNNNNIVYNIQTNITSTNDGVNIYSISYNIYDVYGYNNYSPDKYLGPASNSDNGSSPRLSTLNVLYPNFGIILKGTGLTLQEKIDSLAVNRDQLLEYAANKLIMARILHGDFNIEYLLSSKNTKFLQDLKTIPRLNDVYEWFLEKNNMNNHFLPCVHIGTGIDRVILNDIPL